MTLSKNLITGAVLAGAGCYKTYADYKTASAEQKQRTLIRNTAILGVAATTAFSVNYLFLSQVNKKQLIQKPILNFSKSILKKIFPKKDISISKLQSISDFIANCVKDISVATLSAVTGIYSGYLTDKILDKILEKPDKKQIFKPYEYIDKSVGTIKNNSYVNKIANEKNKHLILSATRVFNTAGFIANPFEVPNMIMDSYDMAKEKDVKKVLEKTSTGIFIGALIPTLLLSIGNSLIKSKKMIVKIPVLALTFWLGDKIGEQISDKLKKYHIIYSKK